MKRLYIGGLGHTVSEKDLKDRFGKFGDVSDVEIITRKDEQGSPLKTFGYININITDAEYKRCIGVLNKSTWKGGTLLIQLAKESFLHRLAEERQQLVENTKTPKIIPQERLVDSLKAAGVENFHMKAAVPGTEIPGHKDWVVSKFGRVLPVLNLKSKGKNKIFKYDPSKHCHNIKRLETADNVMSVSTLTWEIEGGDDEISKKRRGEFPKQKPCPKRSKVDLSSFLSSLAQSNRSHATAIGNKDQMGIQPNGLSATNTGKQRPVVKNPVCVLNSDADSDDEIRMLVAQEGSRNPKQTSAEDDHLEVVGDDFVVKSNAFWSGAEQDGVKSLLTSPKEDEDYDSADTDEILTQRKTQKTQDSPTKSNQNKSESDDASDEASDDDVSIDSDYEAMMGNCSRLDLSLADLEQLAKNAEVMSDDESVEEPKEELKSAPRKSGNNPEDILASLFEGYTPEIERKNQVTKVSLPAFIGTKDLFGGPQPILKRVAQSIDCESPKRLEQDLNSKERSLSEDASQQRSSQQKRPNLKVQSTSKKLENRSSEDDSSSEEVESTSKTSSVTQSVRTVPETELKRVSSNSNTPIKPKQTKTSTSSSSESSSEESETSDDDDDEEKSRPQPKVSKPAESKKVQEKVESHPAVLHSSVIDAQKQQKDNQKRLAALEQRQKESEQQKKLIQGALSSVDTVKANKSKHIVFGSDEEEDEPEEPTSQKKRPLEDNSESDDQQTSTSKEKEKKKPGGHKLFDSEDEDEGAEDDRFQIKPQFQGKAGQKLMKLQARFGTDSRFQIDSRFLESDNEAEDQDAAAPETDAEQQLLQEKKRSLDILQSILKTSIQPQNTRKSKTFKDVSSLHYDPTQEEHAAFESKMEQPKTESKAARRKKREEAEKLPEVSKDIYFEVSADLKEVFGTARESEVEKETVSWDKEAETEEIPIPMDLSFTANADAQEDAAAGFMFSFFGEGVAMETTPQTDEYKIETLKGAKFSWQVDPRFQDSSSDEEGVAELEEDQSASFKVTEEPTASKKSFFFFYQGDERLKEGPGMFCRSGKLGEQREAWEEKRTSLRDECRKKHRDAKRRQRPSLKTS